MTRRSVAMMSLAGALIITGTGCSDLTGSKLPAGINNPSYYKTPQGAQGMYQLVAYTFESTLLSVVRDAGLLTDELEDKHVGTSPGVLLANKEVQDPLDERILPSGSDAAA